MEQGILVFIEERQGIVKKTSLEVLSAARKLADTLGEQVVAFCIGTQDPSVQLAHYGADKVIHANHDLLSGYSPEGYAETLAQGALQMQPRIILGSATAM